MNPDAPQVNSTSPGRAKVLPGWPLAWHLAALCFALVLPILFLAGVLTWVYAEFERDRIGREALTTAASITARADLELAGLIAATEVLALSRSLQDADLDRFDAHAREVYRRLAINVVLRDTTGRQLVNTRLPRGASLPINAEPESDQAVMERKTPYVSNLFIGAVARRPLVIINVPVLRNEDVVYLLNLSLEPERIRDLILRRTPPAGWTFGLVDRRGQVIAHSNHQSVAAGQPLGEAIWTRITAHQGLEGEVAVDGPGGRVRVSFNRSQLSGWIAVVIVPEALASAPMRRSVAGLVASGAFIVAFASALAILFSRRIEKPVKALAAVAAGLERGEATRPIMTPVREISEASAALSNAAAARLQAEAALRDGEARLRLAQAAGRVGTWDWDVQNRRVICSASYCELYGLDPKGPGHQTRDEWLTQVHPEDRERVMKVVESSLTSGSFETEYRIVRPDHSVRWIAVRGAGHFDAQGVLTRFIGANVDVTEARQSAERLRELQFELLHASRLSAMGQMAAALAHELNQPLGAAANFLGAARLALDAKTATALARASRLIEKASEQTVRAGAIVRRLRDFVSRGETEKQIVDPNQLIEDAVALALVGVRKPNVQVRFDFLTRKQAVLVDRIQIQQVVFNLVRNALEETESKPSREIAIATRARGDRHLEVSVTDNGRGLPGNPEMLFRPFASTKPKGMGVGLSICRTIIEAHDGRLWAEPSPAGGAAFRFTLPTVPPERDVTHA